MTPGSDEAIEQGCTCPVMDNAHGKGFSLPHGDGTTSTNFWVSADCPLHGVAPKAGEEEE